MTPSEPIRTTTTAHAETWLEFHDRLGLRVADQARLLGVSPRTMGTLRRGEAPTEQNARRLAEMGRLLEALTELMEDDEVATWLGTPNDAFGGLKPIEMIERGHVDQLWQMVYMLRAGEPG
ncbi:MAG: antitoxin Xre/MbcA/ParS toxin-binding domain-containing protein [Planctomycetota bacterium]